MASSASAIMDELVSVLAGMTDVGAGNATWKGYDILETATSRYCFIVRPSGGSNKAAAFGGDIVLYESDQTYIAEGYVKEQGDTPDYMEAQATLIQDMQTTIDDHRTLNSTVATAMLARWEVPDMELNIGGQVWQPIRFWIECKVV